MTRRLTAVATQMHALGLQVLPARENGTKAPIATGGEWKTRQSTRTTIDEIRTWYDDQGRGAIGVVCGSVSGNLLMFEFEGRAVAEGWFARFEDLVTSEGLGDLWDEISSGYVEATPSGGLHFYWRVADGPAPTKKLARREKLEAEWNDSDRKAAQARIERGHPPYRAPLVMVETKGEGGYSITAPTNGTTHPTGKVWEVLTGSWDRLPTITAADTDRLLKLAGRLDTYDDKPTAPEKPLSEPRRPDPLAGLAKPLEGTRPGEEFNQSHTCGDVLVMAGFTLTRTDQIGTHWTRPGKDARDGTSATVYADNGHAVIWSSSVDIGDKTHGESMLDPFGLYAALLFHGDRSAAGSHIRAQNGPTVEMRADPGLLAAPSPAVKGEEPPVRPTLPVDLWQERPYLDHIRRAALARYRSADVVLATVLARVAAFVPHWIVLPATVGTRAPLNLFVLVASDSADGKSSAMGVAHELLPMPNALALKGVIDPLVPTTGAGLIEAFMGEIKEPDPDGKTSVKTGEPVMVPVRRQVRNNMYAEVDEGSRLVKNQERNGDLFQTICTMFSGGPLGTANATKELYRRVDRLSYAAGFVVGWQARNLRPLIADADSGTPGRFLFVQAIDPTIGSERPEWPGPLPFTLADLGPMIVKRAGADGFFEMGIDETVADEIRSEDLDRATGRRRIEVIDGHRGLVRLKVAALLALLDGRVSVSADDWRLAGVIVDNSEAVRSWAINVYETADRTATVERATYEETARQIGRGALPPKVIALAQRIGRRVQNHDGEPVSERNVRRAVVNMKRGDGPLWVEALDLAIEAGYVEKVEHGLISGPTQVAE